MQYHYLVMYDDKYKSWSVESDITAYLPDGNIYDNSVFPGWSWPEEGSPEEELDWNLYKTLQYIVDTWPVPEEAVSG